MARPRSYFIALYHGVHNDDKTLLVAHDLGLDPMAVVGHLTSLWLEVLLHRESDDITGLPDIVLEKWAGWTGKPGTLAQSLRHRSWIKQHGEATLVSGWMDANGSHIKELDRKRRHYAKVKSSSSPSTATENQRPIRREQDRTEQDTKPTPKPRRRTAYSDQFESVWTVYPRDMRQEKATAFGVWTRLRLDPMADVIRKAIVAQDKANDAFRNSGGKGKPPHPFPYPARYLDRLKWEDEIKHATGGTASPKCAVCGFQVRLMDNGVCVNCQDSLPADKRRTA